MLVQYGIAHVVCLCSNNNGTKFYKIQTHDVSSCIVFLYSVLLEEPSAPTDHNVAELSTIPTSRRSALEEILANAREAGARVTGAIDARNKVKEDVHLVIDQAFKSLQRALEMRKATFLSELESISLSKTTALTLEKEKVEKIEVASRILLTHTDDEIAALGVYIQTEQSAMLKIIEHISLVLNTHNDISAVVQTDGLIRELSKFGCISDLSLSPSSSTWTSTSVAKVKTDFHVKVESKTSNGEVCPHGGLQMKAEIRSNTGAVVHGEVEDHGDGTYTTTLIPQTAGPHQLLITLNGQHVQNSPHDLYVLAVHDDNKYDCKTLGNIQQVIKCPVAPCSVAIHGRDFYVATATGCIYVFDTNGHPLKAVGTRELKNGLLYDDNIAFGIGMSKLSKSTLGSCERDGHQFVSLYIKENQLYVANKNKNCIRRLTMEGNFIDEFSANGATGCLIDKCYRIFVSNCSGNKINVFSHKGDQIFTIDGNATGDCSFQSPYGLAFDPLENIHVAAFGSNTIKVFTKEGVYIRKYGDLKGPRGIAIDSDGCSFVTEYEGNCISIFDPQGNQVHTVGGSLHNPFGLALDSTNNSLYIANYGASIVVKYSTCTRHVHVFRLY